MQLIIPNDGPESVVIPVGNTTTARIKVESANNIFFDISNSDFTVTGPLPVTFLSFKALKEGTTARLNWQTTNEINVDHYTAEASRDGLHFAGIATKTATGSNSSSVNAYTALHLTPVIGQNYYRIAEVDKDGRTTYSQTEQVYFDASTVPVVSYDNSASVILDVPSITKPFSIRLFNSIGQVVISNKSLDQTHTILNIGNLAKGVYLLNVYYNDQVYSFKVLK